MTQPQQNHKPKLLGDSRPPGRPGGASTRWPGIKHLAKLLGRNPNYVRLVLDGRLQSRPLMERILSHRDHPIVKLLQAAESQDS